MHESVVLFECEGEQLIGIVATPRVPVGDVGVVVVVGGPQYRAGSHRQFVLLARYLAKQGLPCMRFDYRGMGDSTGGQRGFEQIDADIRAAVDTFMLQSPSVKRVVLWGLCDGASAACLYAPRDSRVAGLVLLNPWVRTTSSDAKVMLKHYYRDRFLSLDFWKKFIAGGVPVVGALKGLMSTAQRASSSIRSFDETMEAAQQLDLPRHMARGLRSAGRPYLVILSGCDFVAREFEQVVASDNDWRQLLEKCELERLDEADHTFSRALWREHVEQLSTTWVRCLKGKKSGRSA